MDIFTTQQNAMLIFQICCLGRVSPELCCCSESRGVLSSHPIQRSKSGLTGKQLTFNSSITYWILPKKSWYYNGDTDNWLVQYLNVENVPDDEDFRFGTAIWKLDILTTGNKCYSNSRLGLVWYGPNNKHCHLKNIQIQVWFSDLSRF